MRPIEHVLHATLPFAMTMSSRFLPHRSLFRLVLPLLAVAFAALGPVPASRADQTLFSTYPHDGSFGVAAVIHWLIGFGAVPGDASLSPSGDLVEAAANLFERLHEAGPSRVIGARGFVRCEPHRFQLVGGRGPTRGGD